MVEIPLFFKADQKRVDISEARRVYDEYRNIKADPESVSGVDVDTPFNQDLRWAQVGDAVRLLELGLTVTRVLVNEIGCTLLASKKRYVDLVQQLAVKVKDTRWKSEVDRSELAERHGKIEKLRLKVQLFADDFENVARIQAQVTAKDVELTASRVAASPSARLLDEITRTHASL